MTNIDTSPANLSVSSRHDRRTNERAERASLARRTRLVGRVSLALPVVGVAAGAWLLSRGHRRRSAGLGTLGASLGLALLRWQLQRFVTEKVPYQLEATVGDIELRSYPPQVLAETVVQQADWSGALNEGFERLAGYIFGNNDGAERLSMTAPVLSTLASEPGSSPRHGETSPATAPGLAAMDEARQVKGRTVAFVMPADRQLNDLPAPRDPRVRLRSIPERVVAVLTFRGDYQSGLPAEKRETLLRRLREVGFVTEGDVTFAGYDPPSTLPALRRNEVMVELADV